MKKALFTILFLCCTLMLHATIRGTHLSLNLRHENIPVEQATQRFGTWMKTSTDMTFVLVKDETDDLGFRHQTYEQQLGGIPVDASRLLVHSKDGRITYVNGYVMETDAVRPPSVPARRRSMPAGGEVVLVETEDGSFCYAVKSFDESTHEYVYTDMETGRVVKRLSTVFYSDAPKGQKTISSESYYYGTQQIDVTQLDDGCLIMADSIRKIYTYDAAGAGEIPSKYNTKDSLGIKNYFDNELIVAQTRRDQFSMQEITTATFTLSEAAKEKIGTAKVLLSVKTGNITIDTNNALDDFPLVFNPLEHDSKNRYAYPLRMNDTDSTIVVLKKVRESMDDLNEEELWDLSDEELEEFLDRFEAQAIDTLIINPTPAGGNAEVTIMSKKGYLTAKVSMKGIGHYGVDAHWGMERVFDFYKTTFNHNSYDNAGSPIISIINPVENKNDNALIGIDEPNANASYSPQPFMKFGRGGDDRNEQGDISIIGHEFTHLVTFKTAGLEYKGESGALNEAFSDIICASVNKYVTDRYLTDRKDSIEYIYSVGSDSDKNTKAGMARSFCDPFKCKRAKAVLGKYWVDPTQTRIDYGGVHFNSGVLSFWFYLLAEGYDPAGPYSFDTTVIDKQWAESVSWKGIGIEKAQQIAFRMLTRYLFPKADFRDAYKLSFAAAQDLGYDENSTEYATMQLCWKAVAPDNYLELEPVNGFGLEITSLKTIQTYDENYTEMVSYTGDELKMGVIAVTLTATVKDIAKIREIYQKGQSVSDVKCYFRNLTATNYGDKELDYTDVLNAFMKKCSDDPNIGNGYQETFTKEITHDCGGIYEVLIDDYKAGIYDRQEKVLLEDAYTYASKNYSDLVVGQGKIVFAVIACSGYPIKVLPGKDGETTTFQLYRVCEDKSETLISEDSQMETESEILNSYDMKKSDNKRYVGAYFYELEEPIPPGTYKLKVSFAWEALKDAELIYEVTGDASAIGSASIISPAATGKSFDLQGREVSTPRKGILIRDGKKVIVK